MTYRMTTSRLLTLVAVVMLAAPVDLISPDTTSADPLPYGPDTCTQGFVWREANPTDHVCVTPDVRTRTAQENQLAAQRVNPAGGPYGPDTCLQGFVWREAFTGDHVCVTPDVRQEASEDNALAPTRKAADNPERPSYCSLGEPFSGWGGC